MLVLVAARAHGSAWVGKEQNHALGLQKERGGPDAFPVVPLQLDGTPLGAFEAFFDEPPIHVAIQSTALDAAPHAILVALGLRLPTDAEPQPQPLAEPVEELVLELSDPRIVTRADGSRRAQARAWLVHAPATPLQREVHSTRIALDAPLCVIEATDLRWYLEDYAVWPSPLLAERAPHIEADFERWGRLLHDAALPALPVAVVLESWSAVGTARVVRRLSVEVDASPDAGTSEVEVKALREASTLLWELLHDGRRLRFQGAQTLATSTAGAAIYYTTSGVTPASSPSQYSAPLSIASTTTNEGQTCSFTGTPSVRYGQNGVYATRTARGSNFCSNSAFGDPLPNVAK